ncbi:MAG: hypothetical protein J07HX5_00737 [halophilic archaeon J07HX5]|nr:MAG: hypothetical protein J07HX5_00737 [halophilic archaeon J07HX5]
MNRELEKNGGRGEGWGLSRIFGVCLQDKTHQLIMSSGIGHPRSVSPTETDRSGRCPDGSSLWAPAKSRESKRQNTTRSPRIAVFS